MPEPRNEPMNEPARDPTHPNGPQEPQQEPGFEVLIIPQGRFPLGQLVATPGALAALEEANTSPAELVARHMTGDWGTVDKEDWAANDRALLEGTRLLSAYALPQTGEKLWVITEWDRSATTILRPDEY
jgi:hypothetical protein